MTKNKTRSDKKKTDRHELIKGLIPAIVFILIIVIKIYLFPFRYTFYDLKDGTYAVSDYEGIWPYITIPSSHKGKPVSYIVHSIAGLNQNVKSIKVPDSITAVNMGAFASNMKLKKVALPDTLTEISDSMFYNCKSLKKISIPQSVTKIGKSSFSECNSLKKIYIHSGITSIGVPITNCDIYHDIFGGKLSVSDPDETSAFVGCTGIEEFTVDKRNKYYSSEDGILYDKNKTIIIAYPPAKPDKSFIIPESVTIINADAFNSCSNLKNITIPSDVTQICINAFKNCTSIHELKLPETITSIEKGAFSDCSSLENINLPENGAEIDDTAFDGCNLK